MPVRAVTPQVPALGGGLQFYRDLDFHDAANDDLVTGDPYDPEWPDKPLRLKPTRGSHVRPVRGVRAPRAYPDARERGPRVSLDGRPALSPSSPDRDPHTPATGRAIRASALSGAPETLLSHNSGASNPSDEAR